MANFQPLHNVTHKDVKITDLNSVADLTDKHALGIVAQEFSVAAAQYPIAFIRDEKNDQYFPVVLLGLEQNKNLFVSEDGKWTGRYLPARYTHKPFSVVQNPNDNNSFGIAIDMDSDIVSTSEGQVLFNEDGSESEYLEKRKNALIAFVEQEHVTRAFIEELVRLELLHPQNINVKVMDKEYNLNGIHIVNEKKLAELSDEEFLNLRKRGYLGPIYSHLSSMHQVNSLIEKQAERLK